jgi:hypothetical protein
MTAISREPTADPMTMAVTAAEKLIPNQAALKPSRMMGKLRPAANQTKNCELGLPCRSLSGMWSTPKGSTLVTALP